MAKYPKEKRMEIGRKIYEKEINAATAAVIYGISIYTARDYMRLYKAELELRLAKRAAEEERTAAKPSKPRLQARDIETMSREELVRELKRVTGMI